MGEAASIEAGDVRCLSIVKFTKGRQALDIIVLNKRGVLTAAFEAETAIAEKFQEWGLTVLVNFMDHGYHVEPGPQPVLSDRMDKLLAYSPFAGLSPSLPLSRGLTPLLISSAASFSAT